MPLDLLIRGANLPDGRTNQDIAVNDGRIVEVRPAIEAEAAREIEARNRLVSPPFVDTHFHMDAAFPSAFPVSTNPARSSKELPCGEN